MSAEGPEPPSIDQRRLQLRQALHTTLPDQPLQLDWQAEVDSTNLALLRAPASAVPQVLVADRQHAGRGQSGRRWHSPPGNLYASVRCRLPAPLSGALALEIGLAVLQALRLPAGFGLKWPNDLYLKHPAGWAKWGGLLIEPLSATDVVIGLGLNVNGPLQVLEDRLSAGLNTVLPVPRTVIDLACLAIPALLQAAQCWQPGRPGLPADYAPHDLLRGHWVRLESPQRPGAEMGRALGIQADGALLLLQDGLPRAHYGGHVVWSPVP